MLIEMMSSSLLIEPGHLKKVQQSASHLYKEYCIPKGNGIGHRVIHHPTPELKLAQRWLAMEIIGRFPVHQAVKSYKLGTSIRDNAEIHKNSRFLMRIDFKDFFPSIKHQDIFLFINAKTSLLPDGWSPNDSDAFCQFVCRWGNLTIGAPSSPGLSNVICHKLDEQLWEFSTSNHFNYSRYADDLYFSSNQAYALKKIKPQLTKILRSLDYPARLWVNHQKTINLSKKHHRTVTGLVLTSEGSISIGRKKKRFLKHLIHKYDVLDPKEKKYLRGYLAHVKSVEPRFINCLFKKYGPERVEQALKGE